MRFIHYIKRKFHERRAKKQQETADDRAARITANATVWIAILTAVIIGVSIAQWNALHSTDEAIRNQASIMKDQLDEMKSASRQTDELIKANIIVAEAAKKQANAAAETALISQGAFIANQRAWIGPKSARVSVEPNLSSPMTIIIDYQNTGRQPATNFDYNVEVFTVTEDEFKDRLRRTANFMTKCMRRPQVEKGMVIYPTIESRSYNLKVPFDNKLADEIRSENKGIILQGCFTYKTLMTVHHSFFCYFSRKVGSQTEDMSICDIGQHAD